MPHLQRLVLTVAALITVSSCSSEAPKLPPPPQVQAAAARLVEFTEGIAIPSVNSTSRAAAACTCGGGGSFGASLLQELTVIRAATVSTRRCR